MEIADEFDLIVIEDCAQSPGTKYNGKYVGTIGDIGVFSFQETKNIMTGEGGMIITNSLKYARKCRLIRNHGESVPDESWQDKDLVNLVGLNFRMTEMTAALGIAQLKKLDESNDVRVENTRYLTQALEGLSALEVVRFGKDMVPHILPLIYDAEESGIPRSTILKALRAEGLPVGSGYVRLMNENPIFQKKIAYGEKGCPWNCLNSKSEISYSSEAFLVANELIRKKFIWFYRSCGSF